MRVAAWYPDQSVTWIVPTTASQPWSALHTCWLSQQAGTVVSASVVATQTSAGVKLPGPVQHLADGRCAGRANVPDAHRDDQGAVTARYLCGSVAAGVGHGHQVHRDAAQRLRDITQASQAEGQQVLFIVRGNDDADSADHAIPPLGSPGLGSLSKRARRPTSYRRQASSYGPGEAVQSPRR